MYKIYNNLRNRWFEWQYPNAHLFVCRCVCDVYRTTKHLFHSYTDTHAHVLSLCGKIPRQTQPRLQMRQKTTLERKQAVISQIIWIKYRRHYYICQICLIDLERVFPSMYLCHFVVCKLCCTPPWNSIL